MNPTVEPGPVAFLAALAAAVTVIACAVVAGRLGRRSAAHRLRRRLTTAGHTGHTGPTGYTGRGEGGPSAVGAAARSRLALPPRLDELAQRLRGRSEVSETDLADLLAIAVRRLRGGDALEGSLVVALTTAPGPAADRLEPVVARARQGAPLEVGLARLADDPTGGNMAATARSLGLAVEVGGSQAEALDAVVAGLRRRHRLHLELNALAAQARASAMVMVAAPLAFGALALALDGRIRATVLSEPLATVAVVAGIGLDLVAAGWMRRIVTTRR